MSTDRLEAIGPRGEACIIVRIKTDTNNGSQHYRYALATGDRLRPTDSAGVLETFDGSRRYRLREPLPSGDTLGDAAGHA